MRLYAKYEDWKDSSWFTVPLPSFRMVSVEGSQACAVSLKTKDVKFLAKVEKSVSNICNLNTIVVLFQLQAPTSKLKLSVKTKWPLEFLACPLRQMKTPFTRACQNAK